MLARKLLLSSLALLLLSFVILSSCYGQTRLGLHFTAEEVAIWRQRATNGPYKSTGDASVNSPADWSRILSSANAYISSDATKNYLSDRWNGGYQGTGYVPKGFTTEIINCEPKGKIDKMMHAAFVYLITKDTKYSSRVKDEILNYYIKHSLMDFSNQNRWGLGANSFNDINPGFYTAAGITKLLFAYDYVKDTFSQQEKALVDAWLYKAGNFFRQVVDEKIAALYSDRANSIFKDPAARAFNVDGKLTHDKGYAIPNVSHWYNNRRGDMVRFYALVGVHLNNAAMKQSAKLFFKEWLKFGIFPDGTMNEYYRGSLSMTEQGYQYSLVTISQMVEIADAFARTGDKELYDFTTSDGLAATKGGNKSLLLVIQNVGKYVDGSLSRYFPGKAGQADYKINGIAPLEGKHYINDTWLAQANIYYKDSNFSSIYQRKKQGTAAYPARATNHGSYQPWSGPFAAFPGKLFMFGQMEDKVNPFPGQNISSLSSTVSSTGNIVREHWEDLAGTSVSSIPVNTKPSYTTPLSSFEVPANSGDNYGTRVRGYVHVPVTGNYTFYLAGDNNCELWLSTDATPANRKRIAYINAWTGEREWNKFNSQKSVTIYLSAGKKYYIEALQKEETAEDHLSVGWTLPNTSAIEVISGNYLSPYIATATAKTASSEESLEAVNHSTVYPNPFEDKLIVQTIYEGELQISLLDALGRVCYQTKQIKESLELAIDVSQIHLKPGIYFMQLQGKNVPDEVIRLLKK